MHGFRRLRAQLDAVEAAKAATECALISTDATDPQPEPECPPPPKRRGRRAKPEAAI